MTVSALGEYIQRII